MTTLTTTDVDPDVDDATTTPTLTTMTTLTPTTTPTTTTTLTPMTTPTTTTLTPMTTLTTTATADKADTGYDFESAEAKLASIDATLEAMADNPIIVESLATTRAALVQEMATARGAAQENAGRSLVLSFRKDILEMAMSFRETYTAQAGKRLDNFVLQFVRNPSATPVSLGYEFGEGEERETDTISVKVHPNFTQAPAGATATPNRATRQARSGNADGKTADERKAERELKDAAKAAEKENKAREEARIAAVIANGDIHGMVVTAPNGTIERVSYSNSLKHTARTKRAASNRGITRAVGGATSKAVSLKRL